MTSHDSTTSCVVVAIATVSYDVLADLPARDRERRPIHADGQEWLVSVDLGDLLDRGREAVLDAPGDRLGTAHGIDLAVGGADVGLHRVDAQVQLVGDLLVGEPLDDPPQDGG